ncbi:LysR family transcriptional regulator [Acinetobacter sp. ESBL14]|uniref:LysR family transcriptional regulator n=1 Tax=Acinetobacter sp. ESBL14 TaxID=3077329 RepID=UPI002FC5CB1C
MDRIDCINTFLSVVEHGNFSISAKNLNISRDLVSKRIQYLENDLKVSLFIRTTRRMNLTPCGEKFYQHAKVMMSELEWAKYEISYDQQYPEGELKINAPLSFSRNVLTNIISDFIQQFPFIKIDLYLTDQFIDIYEQQFDLTLRVDEIADKNFQHTVINTYTRSFYASNSYLEKRGIPDTIDDLKKHDFLLYSSSKNTHNKITLNKNETTEIIQCYPKFICNNGDLLLDLCTKGHGIIFLPDFIAKKYFDAGEIAKCLEDYHSPMMNFYAIYPNGQKVPKKLQIFIDFLIRQFKNINV